MVVILSCAIPKWDGGFDHLKTLLMCSRSCDFHSFDFAALLKPVPLGVNIRSPMVKPWEHYLHSRRVFAHLCWFTGVYVSSIIPQRVLWPPLVHQTIFLWNPAVEVDLIGEPKAAQFDMLPSSESGKPIGFARSCKDRLGRFVSSLCMAARSLDFSCWGMGKECFHCHFGKFGNICKENKWPIAFQPVRATRPSEGSLRGSLSRVSTREPKKTQQTGVQD